MLSKSWMIAHGKLLNNIILCTHGSQISMFVEPRNSRITVFHKSIKNTVLCLTGTDAAGGCITFYYSVNKIIIIYIGLLLNSLNQISYLEGAST